MSQCENCNDYAAAGLTLCALCITREHLKETIALEARIKELKEKLSIYEWRDIPDDHVFPTGRYLIEIVDEDGPLVHLMEVEQSFTAIGGCLSFNMPGKRTRYMALPTPPSTQEVNKEALKNLTQIGEEMGLYDLPPSTQEGEE